MIKSMTGFGRSEISEGKRKISVEMKSVNHRYLEAGIKMPKKLNIFEARIRDLLKKYAQRGKIDIFITYEDLSETNVNLKYNRDIAAEYMDIFEQMASQFHLDNDMTVSALSRYPEVITTEEVKVDEEELWHFIEKAVCAACEQFVAARITEGEHLKKDLLDKLDNMAGLVDFIEARSPQIMKEYRGKLEQKVTELLGLDQRQFRQIAMIAQGDFQKLLLTKRKLQRFLVSCLTCISLIRFFSLNGFIQAKHKNNKITVFCSNYRF